MVLIADRYEPTGNAAWGGMSEVHECFDQHLNRHVMLKRVKRLTDFRRLMDEKKALLRVRSRHVVELLDVVEYDYGPEREQGLILEKIDGADLQEQGLNFGPDYYQTLWQIASGIADIHDAGVIHRDIKPQNIRKDPDGVLKILDFGLSREVGRDDKTRSIIGTAGYMAPELRGTKTIALSPALDVYAFGVLCISLLKGPSALKLAASGPDVSAADLTTVITDPRLSDVLASCLSSDAARRPSIGAVRDLLASQLLDGRHRAIIISAGKVSELSSANKSVKLRTQVGGLTISYDGRRFTATAVSGKVSINNTAVAPGSEMPQACVVTFGDDDTGRAFATFDSARPEVAP